MSDLIAPIVSMGAIGAVLALILVIADRKLRVKEDQRVEKIQELLPGSNCGACGAPGCRQFAEQLVSGEQGPAGCMAGGPEVAKKIGSLLGVEVKVGLAQKARVLCLGGNLESQPRAQYEGVRDCQAVTLQSGGDKSCVYGCLGYGSCSRACPFDAIEMTDNGLPFVDDFLCTGCEICVAACPRHLMAMKTEETKILVGCSSLEKGKAVKQVCARGCIACKLCVKVCPQDAIVMDGNLPVIDDKKCDACGICVEKCPTDSLVENLSNQLNRVSEKKKAV